jgi:hypothetical protein
MSRPGPTRTPADNQTETVFDGPPLEPERFTDRGEEAETAAFEDEGAYSGGDFAGGHAVT